eukprot:6419464-Pyramimonas_sp.AAC.1
MGPPTARAAATTAATTARWAVCSPSTGPPRLGSPAPSRRRPQAARASMGSVGWMHAPSLHTVRRGARGCSSASGGNSGSSRPA